MRDRLRHAARKDAKQRRTPTWGASFSADRTAEPVLARHSIVGDGRRSAPLGELLSAFVGQQAVVIPKGHRQAEQRLQKAMNMRCVEQIRTPRHQRDPVCRIVQGRGQVIACGCILSHDDDVPTLARVCDLLPGQRIFPEKLPAFRHRPVDVDLNGHSWRRGNK